MNTETEVSSLSVGMRMNCGDPLLLLVAVVVTAAKWIDESLQPAAAMGEVGSEPASEDVEPLLLVVEPKAPAAAAAAGDVGSEDVVPWGTAALPLPTFASGRVGFGERHDSDVAPVLGAPVVVAKRTDKSPEPGAPGGRLPAPGGVAGGGVNGAVTLAAPSGIGRATAFVVTHASGAASGEAGNIRDGGDNAARTAGACAVGSELPDARGGGSIDARRDEDVVRSLAV